MTTATLDLVTCETCGAKVTETANRPCSTVASFECEDCIQEHTNGCRICQEA